MPSPFAHQGGNFNFEYATASGGVASLVTTNAQRGVNAAAMLLGTGVWWIRPGANVAPDFSQKYFAVYSQNDWRATSKLTVNLGLRWEVQPGPTERSNRMSSWDFTAQNAFGTPGAIAFPGVDGYSRNLWDTTYDNWGPRVGAAYQWNDRTVLRGGFGITYLPTNTGYFSSPVDYGVANFAGGVLQQAYGTNPAGVPVIRFSDPAPVSPAIGGNPEAPQVYGIGEARFDRHLENGQARQWNFFIERALGSRWMASIGYSASVSRNLHNRSFPIQNLQSIDPALLSQWRDQFIASNGTLNPATQLVQNPFQPATGPLVPFAGRPRPAHDSTAEHALPVSAARRLQCRGQPVAGDGGLSRDDSARQPPLRERHDAGRDLHLVEGDRQHRHRRRQPGLQRRGKRARREPQPLQLRSQPAPRLQRHPASARGDVPLRVAVRQGQADRRVEPGGQRRARRMAGEWFRDLADRIPAGDYRRRPTARPCSGPIVSRAWTSLLPENLWGWYDGSTQVTLPSGRIITPPARTYLKYNPDAFAGRVVTTPNGRIVADQFWYGNAAITYDEIRTDNRFNIDMSIRREFALPNAMRLELGADAMNILNHTQFSGSYTGALGGTVTTANPALGLVPGMGNANSYGTRGMGTYNPRQIMLRATLRF